MKLSLLDGMKWLEANPGKWLYCDPASVHSRDKLIYHDGKYLAAHEDYTDGNFRIFAEDRKRNYPTYSDSANLDALVANYFSDDYVGSLLETLFNNAATAVLSDVGPDVLPDEWLNAADAMGCQAKPSRKLVSAMLETIDKLETRIDNLHIPWTMEPEPIAA